MYYCKVSLILAFYLLKIILCENDVNITDLNRCKLTHKGLEYTGEVSKTAGGVRCQYWHTHYPVHTPSDDIVDKLFPDGSKAAARNFCRNPTADEDGPWCYTLDEKLRNDYCDVPLCYYQDCRLSGPGMEYAGKLSVSGSEHSCLYWQGRRARRFPTQRFPGGWRKSPKSRCRNPDGDPAGPWCYVRRGDGRREEKAYCDVPFCDEPDCLVYTGKAGGVHTLYTSLSNTTRNLTLALKLWSPDLWRSAAVSVALSTVAVPASGQQLRAWGAGVELIITDRRAYFTSSSKVRGSWRGVLTGKAWTRLWISWGSGRVAMGREGETKPMAVAEYSSKGTILGQLKGHFPYYSIMGAGVLWSEPFLDVCLVRTTTRMDFPRFWPIKTTETGHQISLFVRATDSAILQLRVSPALKFPAVQVVLSERNVTRVMLQQTQNSSILLAEVGTPGMLDYWQWKELSISTLGSEMAVFRTQDVHTQVVLLVDHETVRSLRWFGLGSAHTTAHWTLFCRPKEADEVPPAAPPECAVTAAEVGYVGSQWVTGSGRPCIPWTDEHHLPPFLRNDAVHVRGSRSASRNFCRNLDRNPMGPFCFAESPLGHVVREPCHIRLCHSAVCRKAGTANDYIGQLNVTRSNRACQSWTADMPHLVNRSFRNNTLYPEQSVGEAGNYCRNPSRNIAGTWCYTTDPAVVVDLCYVPDCERPEECMTITRGSGIGRLVYILPEWRKTGILFWIKAWNPDEPDGLDVYFWPLQGDSHYRLVIGAEENEKVYFIYNDGKHNSLLKEKTLPHLIPIDKWGGFWLKILEVGVQLGYQGVDNPLFFWISANSKHTFNPFFISFTSLVGNTMAVSFKCNECHVEKTSTENFTRLYPIGLWSQQPWQPRYNSLILHMRGTGMALVALLTQIGTADYKGLIIGKDKNKLFLGKQTGDKAQAITGVLAPFPLIEENIWVKFVITFKEKFIMVTRNNEVMFKHNYTSPLLFYYFSLAAEEGYVEWSANCEPPDVDLPVRNGGWSPWGPWSCSASCGGGVGVQTRTCSNPRPNIYGQLCSGSDTNTGQCNVFPCGDISTDTEEAVRHRLRTQHFSREVMEGDPVALDCDVEALKTVQREAPRACVNWTKGTDYLSTSSRVQVTRHSVEVISAAPEDSGVYVCMLCRATGVGLALRVHALAVRPRSATVVVRKTRPLVLLCDGVALEAVYSDLSRRWEHEGTVWRDYGITTPEDVEQLTIPKVNTSHAGQWKCVVLQADLGLAWTTSWAVVQVDPAPTFLTYLMEDALTSPLFRRLGSETAVLVFLVLLAVLLVFVVAALVFLYLRYCTVSRAQ